jgi:ketosteroid isomerase-like protein
VERGDAQVWRNRYIAAWLSFDANDGTALFTEDVVYRYHPYDDPIVVARRSSRRGWARPIRMGFDP